MDCRALSHRWLIAAACLASPCFAAVSPVQTFKVTNLVSNGAVHAKTTDENLKNPWGIAYSPTGLFWLGDNASGLSTQYNGNGTASARVVTIPSYPGNPTPGSPTGVVYSASDRFIVKQAAKSAPAQYLFAGQDGTISGWNPAVDPTHAVRMVDRAPYQASYTGLAMAHSGTTDYLYATNFANRSIDVFDNKFRPVTTLAGTFHDETMPDEFAPFNIESIGNKLYVTWARQNTKGTDVEPGAGDGFVDVFNPNGTFVRRLASNGHLNAPWGMAKAPANFGKFSNMLLVGNFGDGTINAYNPTTGAFRGVLKDRTSKPVSIDGLWDITFGNGLAGGKTNTLYFTAGLNDETDGLFGAITLASPIAAPQGIGLSAIASAGGVAVVPEPSSLGLLALAGLSLRRRPVRRR